MPMPSRNPYNFALLQPGVVGFENAEFGVPRLTSNGALLRVNYQVDGSNNTEKDRAGIRQMPMSEMMIREVKVVTTGYAPEFGQSMGLIYNAITPSGTNTIKGQGSYSFQRRSFAAFPFFTSNRTTKPPTEVNVYTVDIGGPIVRDKTHFFGGYEHTERDLSGTRAITVTAANQTALGLSEPAYMPTVLNTEFAIGKVDHQLSRVEPAVVPLHVLRQLHHQQRRRRAQLGAARDRLRRSPAFDRRAADLLAGRERAQRAARAVRHARPVADARLAGRHRPGDHHFGRGEFRRTDRLPAPTRASASPRTSSRSTTRSRCCAAITRSSSAATSST